jgi:hypothetical protein
MLHCELRRLRKSFTIKSSDWVNDFQEPLGLGRFLIIEVPTPKLNALDMATLSGEERDFIDRLNKAYETIKEMELELRNGDWGNVVMKLRNIELFKVNVTKFIKKMISDTTSIEEDKAGELTTAIEKLRQYASDLHHVVSSGKVKDVYTGGKEDAYLAYLLVASITNVLTRKFVKMHSKAA